MFASGKDSQTQFELNKVSLRSWTHLALTWHHVNEALFMYVDDKTVGNMVYPASNLREPSGFRYVIGDGFYGSVMDL